MANLEGEGGCGVIGIACSEKIAARHLITPLAQMRNRGNGKGGGVAFAGLDPEQFGTTQEILDGDYLLAIAYLDLSARSELEKQFIEPTFTVDHVYHVPHLDQDLKIAPPEVILYFVRVKEHLAKDDEAADQIVYLNSASLNRAFYDPKGETRAFVLSHGKNLLVLKMVGYGDDVISLYQLEDTLAHVLIGHHRYPTKGNVWHPGGAHPFVGLHEALVHNGDFANYFSITEYLEQKNIFPHFLTDTEVSVLLFDLLTRQYHYPLEYAIEALAPTTERDFAKLPEEKKKIYQALQQTHMHGSPDGPWFFLIAQSLPYPKPIYRLIGITDTSMLRPQVFALQEGDVSIGFAASEKQAIDASLESLSQEDSRFWKSADKYWNARGGSHTDGGAFFFQVSKDGKMECRDKFGNIIKTARKSNAALEKEPFSHLPNLSPFELFLWAKKEMIRWDHQHVEIFLKALEEKKELETLTLLLDHKYPTGHLKESLLHSLVQDSIDSLLSSYSSSGTVVIDAKNFAADGEDSLARHIVDMSQKGMKRLIIYGCRGHRFIGCGLGPNTKGIRIDVYGSSGDYLASGIDGAEIFVHNTAQDQVGQIMRNGRLVIFGDVGQTYLYGAKGGKAFVRGNAAGRPLINAVGAPRVIINGTCLDYLAESFMAGNPIDGGGFAVINGIGFDEEGNIIELPSPYPGNNLFSLASGGAIYIRDPAKKISKAQLNGGEIIEFAERDWLVIKPYLEENEQLFHIPIKRLLEYKGQCLAPHQVYRKIRPAETHILEPEEAWVKRK